MVETVDSVDCEFEGEGVRGRAKRGRGCIASVLSEGYEGRAELSIDGVRVREVNEWREGRVGVMRMAFSGRGEAVER